MTAAVSTDQMKSKIVAQWGTELIAGVAEREAPTNVLCADSGLM